MNPLESFWLGATLLVTLVAVPLAVARVDKALAVRVALVLPLWLALSAALAGLGVFSRGQTPLPLALAVLTPVALGTWAMLRPGPLRNAALTITPQWLVSIHVVRVIGALFLVLAARGLLPWSFAGPAGWGDITVAVTAPFVAWWVARKRPFAGPLLSGWTLLGIGDFVLAVTLGALSSSGPQRLFFAGPPADPVAELPLSLIPTFGVPLIALLHVATLVQLKAARRRISAELSVAA